MQWAQICYGIATVWAFVAVGGLALYLGTLRSEALAFNILGALAVPLGGGLMLLFSLLGWLFERAQAETKV